MPNWVSNELVLTGPPAALEAALEALGDRESEDQSRRLLNFSQVAPIPATIQSQEPDGAGCFFGEHGDGAMDSECWTVRHWGSTTNALWTSVEGSPAEGFLRYEFSTAWTPARPILEVISSLLPSLSIDFAFVEPNTDVAGRDRYSPGFFWGKADAALDEELCRAVLGDSVLASYLAHDQS